MPVEVASTGEKAAKKARKEEKKRKRSEKAAAEESSPVKEKKKAKKSKKDKVNSTHAPKENSPVPVSFAPNPSSRSLSLPTATFPYLIHAHNAVYAIICFGAAKSRHGRCELGHALGVADM